MYGKIFESMYEGSMVGAGAVVFAVMGYVISRQKPPDFTVELNPKLLAAILGESSEDIEKAIDYLSSPDPISRTDEKEGRRLEKVGSFNYFVVNGMKYHSIRNYEERKAYNREAQRKFREKNSTPPATSNTDSQTAVVSVVKAPRFQKPTISELSAYASEIKFAGFDPQSFLDFYESKGWKIGNSSMKDWKASVRTWQKRNGGFSGSTPTGKFDTTTTDYTAFPRTSNGDFDMDKLTPKQQSIAIRSEN